MSDTLAPERCELSLSEGPRPDGQFRLTMPPAAVSFGYRAMVPLPRADAVDLTGLSYDPESQMAVAEGKPAIFSPVMATPTMYDTWEDHQKWTDPDQDK